MKILKFNLKKKSEFRITHRFFKIHINHVEIFDDSCTLSFIKTNEMTSILD